MPVSGQFSSLRGCPFQHVALRLMKPRDHDQFVPDFHSQQCLGESRFDLEPRVGRTFRPLPRRVCTALHCRSDDANRLECVRVHQATLSTLCDATQTPDRAPRAERQRSGLWPAPSSSDLKRAEATRIRAIPKAANRRRGNPLLTIFLADLPGGRRLRAETQAALAHAPLKR